MSTFNDFMIDQAVKKDQQLSTLVEDVDRLGKTALEIKDQRDELLRALKLYREWHNGEIGCTGYTFPEIDLIVRKAIARVGNQ